MGLLDGFRWVRHRSLHDVSILLRRYGDDEHAYAGSPSPVTKVADLYSDTYGGNFEEPEVWGTLDDIKPTLTEPDQSPAHLRSHFVRNLQGREVVQTIETAIRKLRDL